MSESLIDGNIGVAIRLTESRFVKFMFSRSHPMWLQFQPQVDVERVRAVFTNLYNKARYLTPNIGNVNNVQIHLINITPSEEFGNQLWVVEPSVPINNVEEDIFDFEFTAEEIGSTPVGSQPAPPPFGPTVGSQQTPPPVEDTPPSVGVIAPSEEETATNGEVAITSTEGGRRKTKRSRRRKNTKRRRTMKRRRQRKSVRHYKKRK